MLAKFDGDGRGRCHVAMVHVRLDFGGRTYVFVDSGVEVAKIISQDQNEHYFSLELPCTRQTHKAVARTV